MPPFLPNPLAIIMADESPPGVPRAVVTRARYLGHLIPCARRLSTIADVDGALYLLETGRHAVRINRRWLLSFDWNRALSRAHSLALARL